MSDTTRQRFMCHSYYLMFGMVGLGIFSPLVKFFEDAYGMSHGQMGTLLAVAGVIGAVGSFVGGAVHDRLGARLTMSVATALLAVATTALFRASGIALFVAAVFLFYFSQGGGTVINVVVARLYPEARMRAIALFHGFKGAGNLLAPLAVAASVWLMGDWRSILLVATGVWTVWTAVFLFGLSDGPVSHKSSQGESECGVKDARRFLDAKAVVGLLAFVFLPGAEGTIRTWLPVYLMSEGGFAETSALVAFSVTMAGYTLTRLVLGLNLQGDRRVIILPAVLLMLISFFVVLNTETLAVLYVFGLLLGASFAPFWPALVGALYDYVPEDGHGRITGLFSVFGTAGSFSFTQLVGSLGDARSLKTALLVAPACALAYGLTYYAFSFFHRLRRRLSGSFLTEI